MRYSLTIFGCIIFVFVAGTFGQNGKTMSKGIEIRGTVVDFSGYPWEGALVRLTSRDLIGSDNDKGIHKEAKTDSEGGYSFTGLPGGLVYEVSLQSVTPALREIKEVPILIDERVFEVDFGFEIASIGECPLHFVVGTVTDNKNRAVEGAKVSVVNGFNQRRVLFDKTDKNGNYKVDICNPGQYIVFVNTPDHRVQDVTVMFVPRQVQRTVNFSLDRLPRGPR